jgi:hypothetical protein
VNVWFRNNSAYLSNGKFVSRYFKIVEPTYVKLNYLIQENQFKVTFLPNQQHPDLKASSSKISTTTFKEIAATSTFIPEINNINSLDFNFDGGYTWDKVITKAQASQIKNQTLVSKLLFLLDTT